MILAGVIGWSLRFVGYENATLPFVLVAMFVMALVPVRSACAPGEKRPGPAR